MNARLGANGAMIADPKSTMNIMGHCVPGAFTSLFLFYKFVLQVYLYMFVKIMLRNALRHTLAKL
jgi:hypothetical protein